MGLIRMQAVCFVLFVVSGVVRGQLSFKVVKGDFEGGKLDKDGLGIGHRQARLGESEDDIRKGIRRRTDGRLLVEGSDWDFAKRSVAAAVDDGEEGVSHDGFDAVLSGDADAGTVAEVARLTAAYRQETLSPSDGFGAIAKSAISIPEIVATEGQRGQCAAWEDTWYPPPATSFQISEEPWNRPEICKLVAKFRSGATTACTATLIGPYHILTARHCTLDTCLGGSAVEVQLACGYGFGPLTQAEAESTREDDEEVPRLDNTRPKQEEQNTNHHHHHTFREHEDAVHFGRAFITRCRYDTTFDSTKHCDARSNDISHNLGRDLQICSIDRPLGNVLGYFGLDSVTGVPGQPSLQASGYPAEPNLERFVPLSSGRRLEHAVNPVSIAVSDAVLVADGAWFFAGEAGSPLYYRDDRDGRHYLTAVHAGGKTSCREYNTRITEAWQHRYAALRGWAASDLIQAWDDPPLEFCSVFQYRMDIFDLFHYASSHSSTTGDIRQDMYHHHHHHGGALLGVGRSKPNGARASQYTNHSFQAAVTLHNLGTIPASVTVHFYASPLLDDDAQSPPTILHDDPFLQKNKEETIDIESRLGFVQAPQYGPLGSQDIYLGFSRRTVNSVRRIIHTDLPVSWDPGLTKRIIAWWRAGTCYTDDGTFAVLGRVLSLSPPADFGTATTAATPHLPEL